MGTSAYPDSRPAAASFCMASFGGRTSSQSARNHQFSIVSLYFLTYLLIFMLTYLLTHSLSPFLISLFIGILFILANLEKNFNFNRFIKNSSINSSTMILERKYLKNIKFRNLDLMEDYIFKCELMKKSKIFKNQNIKKSCFDCFDFDKYF